jgi:hypothetical protein
VICGVGLGFVAGLSDKSAVNSFEHELDAE